MTVLFSLVQSATQQLTAANIDDPALDARILISHALNCDRVQLLAQSERLLTEAEIAKINTLIERRAKHEPVGRILGTREFWGLSFALNEATLEPRPDSETLITTALPFKPRRILDLGTGTGCLLLALLHELPEATGLGIDIAPRAVKQAQANAANMGLEKRAQFRIGNWFENVTEKFDLIISNPPYIAANEIPTLMPEVRNYDPRAALDGGADGLAAYRTIIAQCATHLNPNGAAIFEVGINQADAVRNLLLQAGFLQVTTCKDLAGIERCVHAICP